MTEAGSARMVLSPDEGEMIRFGGLGVRFMIEGAQSGGTFALVEHPIELVKRHGLVSEEPA